MGRIPSIDIARGLAMILVIAGHALEMFFNAELSPQIGFNTQAFEIWRFIYAFHMPAFFFISGMALNADKPWQKTVSDSFTLFLMALITHVVGCVVAVAIGNDRYGNLIAVVRPFVTGGQGLSLRITWFLVSLAIVQLLCFAFVQSGIVRKGVVVAVLIALYLSAKTFGVTWFQAQTLLVGASCYLAGYYLRFMLVSTDYATGKVALGAAVCWAVVLATYRLNGGCTTSIFASCAPVGRPSFTVLVVNGDVGFPPLFAVTALFAIAALLFSAELLSRSGHGIRQMLYTGQNTLTLLFVNGLFFSLFEPPLSEKLTGYTSFYLPIVAVIVVLHLMLMPLLVPGVNRMRTLCASVANKALSIIMLRNTVT